MVIESNAQALRRGRISAPGRVYLLTFNTRDRIRAFERWELARPASRAISAAESWSDSTLLCWVLMPDHWHGLLQLGTQESLARCVGRVRAATTRACSQVIGRKLDLWQHGFHDRALRREEDLRRIARYVVANPLRAGLVRQICDYPFWDAVWLDARNPWYDV